MGIYLLMKIASAKNLTGHTGLATQLFFCKEWRFQFEEESFQVLNFNMKLPHGSKQYVRQKGAPRAMCEELLPAQR